MYKLIIAWFLLFAACATPQKLLQQTWKVDDVVFIDSLNTFTVEQKKNISESLKKSFTIRFDKDSNFVASHQMKNIPGKWWMDKRKKVLYTQNTLDGTIVSKIYKLSKSRLRFETTNSEYQTYIYTCSPVTAK